MLDKLSSFEIQQKKTWEIWFRDLPSILKKFGEAFNLCKKSLADNPEKSLRFEEKTLIPCRIIYRDILDAAKRGNGFEEFMQTQRMVEDLVCKINGWFRSTSVAVGVKTTWDSKYFGRFKIPTQYELLISNTYEITVNTALV